MLFASTRDPSLRVGFGAALTQGLAADGGLFVPTQWPQLPAPALVPGPAVAPAPAALDLVSAGITLLQPFLAEDALAAELPAMLRAAFDFPVPLTTLDAKRRVSVLELFHGPTAAFKDFGARFLAAAITRLRRGAPRPLKILVATSGDTGGAVAAAFHRQPGIEVLVLYPAGLVSPTQERQLTCWDGNVRTLAVRGRFDDCQRLVKEAFADRVLRERFELSSANSINLGRLLPQAVYYYASSHALMSRHGEPVSYVIPSGNLGNATACAWARQLGAPIGEIVLAHNANRTMPDYLQQGVLHPRASVATLSSAMDVGNPSNLERLQALYPGVAQMRAALHAVSIDDAATAARIRVDFARHERVWCPHSAVAAEACERIAPTLRPQGPWVIVATADAAKFRESIEPLLGRPLALPESLARLYDRPTHCIEIDPTLAALKAVV
jgi:threonine synthase